MKTQTCSMVELYTYYFIDKQYVEGVQNGKKVYLMGVGNIAMWFYHSLTGLETMFLLFNEQRQKEVQSATVMQHPTDL